MISRTATEIRASPAGQRPSVQLRPERHPPPSRPPRPPPSRAFALELADSLTRAGFDVAGPFASCAEAEKWLTTGAPDAAILDNLLKDGPCDALARDLSQRGVPIIMFSGHDELPSADWKASWVTKPVAFPVLLDVLRREMHEAPQSQERV
jgi:DNA-binding response OmpR family regulator